MERQHRTAKPLLIVFLDFTRFAFQSQRVDDSELADTIDAYYERATKAIESAGGTVVKFIGDATLAVFPEEAVDAAVRAILELRKTLDESMMERDWECRLTAKVHFGNVIAGEFGAEAAKRFDVIGRAVNTTAMLHSAGITLSAEAFERLSPELRTRFKAHVPPVTYIGLDDRPPFRGK
jgi:class 3 adenylate cyclase